MKRMPICKIRLSTGYEIQVDFSRFDKDIDHLTNALMGDVLTPNIKKYGMKKAQKILQTEIIDICENLENKTKTALLSTIIWHLICIKLNRLVRRASYEHN